MSISNFQNRRIAPFFKGRLLDGGLFSSSQLQGKPCWIVFLTTKDSNRILRIIYRLAVLAASRKYKGLKIVCVAPVDRTEFKQIVKDRRLPEFPILFDPEGDIYELFGAPRAAGTGIGRIFAQVSALLLGRISSPLSHIMIAEDGIIERSYMSDTISNINLWKMVEEFHDSRRAGLWKPHDRFVSAS